MGKLFGRLAEYVQATEDGGVPSSSDIVEKVIPDLLVYCFWLAESFGVEQAYLERFVGNIRRLHVDKISAEELGDLERYVAERLTSSRV